MKSQHVITVFLVVAAFLAGSFCAFKSPQPQVPFVEVLVAQRDIWMNTKLDNPGGRFKRVAFRKGEEPREAVFPNVNNLNEYYLMRDLREDEPLKWDSIARVQPPLRPYTVIESPADSSGLLRRGMIVNVYERRVRAGKPEVKLLLEKVLVVKQFPDQNEGQLLETLKVAVAVTEEQTLLLSEAQQNGTLHFFMNREHYKSSSIGDNLEMFLKEEKSDK